MLRTILYASNAAYPQTTSALPAPRQNKALANTDSLQFGGNTQTPKRSQKPQKSDPLDIRSMPLVRQLQTRNPVFARQFAYHIKQAFGSYDAPIFGKEKATLLHVAMLYCCPKVVETLLQMGCKPEVTDLQKRKPIDWLDIPANRQTPKTKDEIRALLKNPPKVEQQPNWSWPISGIMGNAANLWKTVTTPQASKTKPQSQSEIMQAELQELQHKNLRMQKTLGKFGVVLTILNRKYQSQKIQKQFLSMSNEGAARRLGNIRTEFKQTARLLTLRETELGTLLDAVEGLQKELEDQQVQITTLQNEKKGLESTQRKQGNKNRSLTEQNTTLSRDKERLEARIKTLKVNQDKNGQQITKFLDETSKKFMNGQQLDDEITALRTLRGAVQLQLQQAVDGAETLEELQQSIQAIVQEIEESAQPLVQQDESLQPEQHVASPRLNKRRTKSMEFIKADLD